MDFKLEFIHRHKKYDFFRLSSAIPSRYLLIRKWKESSKKLNITSWLSVSTIECIECIEWTNRAIQ